MRRGRNFAGQNLLHLGQFVHQVDLVLQPAGRIDQQDIIVGFLGPLHAVKDHGSRIALFGAGHNVDAIAFGPHGQLFSGPGPEGIGGH